ncbi:MAG: hypothetical protein ACR2G0_13250 [Chthoniobacterales bacterium]
MKILNLFSAIVLASSAGAFAQQQRPVSIQVIASFDYPGEGNSTSAQGINDQGDITGSYDDVNGVTRSFVRYRNGTFSEPIVEPNDTDAFTFARDINNLGTVAGSYGTADGETHGFLLSAGTYTEFDAPNTVSTYIYGSNDSDDLVGVSYATDTSFGMAYSRIGGTTTIIDLPSVKTSFAYGINNAQEVVGLYYERRDFNYHGFYRAPDGTITAPIDAPGAVTTFLSGINERGVIVGRYGDSTGAQHGLVFRMPHFFLSFDYPGATFTSVSGINNQGYVTGRYDNGDGIFHSYLARIRFGR